MIFTCTVGDREIDRVTMTDDSVSYETGAAISLVETKVDSLGQKQAMKLFRSWSNGYVTTTELKE